jgi:Raf kinase inhibitor-like YbhB/YbcL family protein
MATITVTAEAFRNGDPIPREYTCDGQDISPAISWRNSPAETKSFTLMVEDPDAASGTFTHWILLNIPPAARAIPRGLSRKQTLEDGTIQCTNTFGRIGWNGPCPPPGNPHRYFFRLYALDIKLSLSGKENRSTILNAMKGHIIAQGEMMGTYRRQ